MIFLQPWKLLLRSLNQQHMGEILQDPILFSMKNAEEPQLHECDVDYCDTVDHRLYQNHISYQLRKDDQHYTAAVIDFGIQQDKTDVSHEWNTKLAEPKPSIEPFLDSPLGPKLNKIIGNNPLLPMWTTRFQRTCIDLTTPEGSLIKMYTDSGLISAGNKSEPIAEIGLVLKNGTASDLLALGARIAAKYPVIIEPRSNFQRGLLLSGLASAKEELQFPKFNPKKPLHKELEKALSFCYHEILEAQAYLINTPEDPEAVHQLRVKIRQLRALLYFIKPILVAAGYEKIQQVLRDWSQNFSYLREIDALQESWKSLSESHTALAENLSALNGILQTERQNEMARLSIDIAYGIGTPVLLNTWAWLAESISPTNAEFKMPASFFITLRLKKLLKRFYKELQSTDFTDHSSLHALRIRCKKLHYVMTLLEGVLKKDHLKTLSDLKELQQKLGQMCDAPRNVAILEELSAKYGGEALLYETGLFIGFQTGANEFLLNELKSFKLP